MGKHMRTVILVAGWALLSLAGSFAGEEEQPMDAQPAPAKEPFVVAVLQFETKGRETTDMGEAIPDLLSAFLSGDENIELVERGEIKKILEEMALGASGVVKEEQAAKIGYVTGAQFLITGRAFIVGQQLYITSRVISTETSKLAAQVAKGDTDGEAEEIVQDLAGKITQLLDERGASMLPQIVTERDLVKELKERLKKMLQDREMPKFAVVIPEQHVGRPIVDPAAETEVGYLLKACGATLLDTHRLNVSDWAKEFLKETGKEVPSVLHKAEIIIVGEGFSEFAGATEKLLSVKARVEMKAVDVKTGKILAIGRTTTTAVDLAESVAAKTALQKAASRIALQLIPEAVASFQKDHPVEKEEVREAE